jgi:N-acetylneuraminate lyase
MKDRFKGLIAATFTPMHPDGALRLDRVPAVVDYLHRSGIVCLYVVGGTGEGVSLSTLERRQTAEAFVRAAEGKLPVIVHVGHASLTEAHDLAAHAQEIGADAVSAVPPFYFKPASVEVLADCVARIAAGAPRLPFYYYHIPASTGVSPDLVQFIRAARQRVPAFAGIKFTSPNVHEFQSCVQAAGDDLDIFWGVDEMLLSGLAVGARGAVGSTYNYAPALYRRLLEAFGKGDLEAARQWQARSVEMIRIILAAGGLAAQKAAMKLIGQDCGDARLPLVGLSESDTQKMADQLRGIGYFDWAV